MTTLGILTDSNNPNLVPSEKGLEKAFSDAGVVNEVIVWDQTNWSGFKNILIRTPWDYADKSDLFINKIKQATDLGINIIHDPEIILWNMDKGYLTELANSIKVVQTLSEENFNLKLINKYFEKLGPKLVIKPKVGAGGKNTFKVDKDDNLEPLKVLSDTSVIIQPFIESIQSEGEYSFIFFDSIFSHAVVKKAKAGEFRIQEEHGGKTQKYEPSDSEISQTKSMLESLKFKTTYARVDVVRHLGEMYLMEMEVIEPELFLPFSHDGAAKFVAAVKAKLII